MLAKLMLPSTRTREPPVKGPKWRLRRSLSKSNVSLVKTVASSSENRQARPSQKASHENWPVACQAPAAPMA